MDGICTQKRLHFGCKIVHTAITLVFWCFSDRINTVRPPNSGASRTKTHQYFTHFIVSNDRKYTKIALNSGVARPKYYLYYTHFCTSIHRNCTQIALLFCIFQDQNTTPITPLWLQNTKYALT